MIRQWRIILSMKNNKNGFSLIEILLVLAGVGFLIILLSALPNSIKLVSWARDQSLAREIAAKQIETTRDQSYINLALGTQTLDKTTDPRFELLPSGSGQKTIENCDIQICTQSEHVKKITVTINWAQEGDIKHVQLVTFIAEGGLNQ